MTEDLYPGFKGKTCPIDPMRRTTCQKCGVKTNDDPALNMSRNAWCDTCRYLLRDPDTGARYSNMVPPVATMRYLGLAVELDRVLVLSFEERQIYERIPNDSQVELWPELQPRPPKPILAELFARGA